MLGNCEPLRQNVAAKFHGFTRISDEILCYVHGLRTLDTHVLAYVKKRAALDIGACDGDSAVVLMDFAKSVHSFEPSPSNFRQLTRALELNKRPDVVTEAFLLGLSDARCVVRFTDTGDSMARISASGKLTANLTTLDAFWAERTEKIGFVKCDTEGYGVPILFGAKQTLVRHRPVVSFTVYHNFDEFFGIPRLLEEWLVNYSFQWGFGGEGDWKWHELVFLGYPNEALEETG
jgi:FkbM family methyltransferase